MSDINQSNSLIDLAARIKAEHEACTAALRSGLKYAIAAGDLLIEAKSHLEHGAWLPWLKEYCAVSERTARLYMRLAANRDQIEAISANRCRFVDPRRDRASCGPQEDIPRRRACAYGCRRIGG